MVIDMIKYICDRCKKEVADVESLSVLCWCNAENWEVYDLSLDEKQGIQDFEFCVECEKAIDLLIRKELSNGD